MDAVTTGGAGVWIALSIYFLGMVAIGVYGYFKQKNHVEGYMLGGRN